MIKQSVSPAFRAVSKALSKEGDRLAEDASYSALRLKIIFVRPGRGLYL